MKSRSLSQEQNTLGISLAVTEGPKYNVFLMTPVGLRVVRSLVHQRCRQGAHGYHWDIQHTQRTHLSGVTAMSSLAQSLISKFLSRVCNAAGRRTTQ